MPKKLKRVKLYYTVLMEVDNRQRNIWVLRLCVDDKSAERIVVPSEAYPYVPNQSI